MQYVQSNSQLGVPALFSAPQQVSYEGYRVLTQHSLVPACQAVTVLHLLHTSPQRRDIAGSCGGGVKLLPQAGQEPESGIIIIQGFLISAVSIFRAAIIKELFGSNLKEYTVEPLLKATPDVRTPL